VAAFIIADTSIYAINVWSTTKKTAPGSYLEQGIEQLN
jgi:hypothetical protein